MAERASSAPLFATATLPLRSASETFVHANSVFKGVVADINAHPGHIARKPTLRGLVILGDRRASVLADIHQVIGGEYQRHRPVNARLPDLFAIVSHRIVLADVGN
jgi:hypothetical protein